MRGLRSNRVKAVKKDTLIVTVDVGMGSNMGYCTTAEGKDIKPFKFGNTREGLDKLWSLVLANMKRFRCNTVIVGYESTGLYAEPFVDYLRSKPVTIVQVNPMHTKRVKEIDNNSPLKTDEKDPRVIADIVLLGHALSVVVPEDVGGEIFIFFH
jgi:transposase